MRRLGQKYLEPAMPGFRTSGHNVYRMNTHWTIALIWFESSAYSKNTFYVSAGCHPLFVPYPVDVFLKRIGPGWNLDEESEEEVMEDLLRRLKRDALPSLDALAEPRDWIEGSTLASGLSAADDRVIAEVVAYALVLAGRFQEGRRALDELEQRERTSPDAMLPRASELRAERVALVRRALDREGNELTETFEQWRRELLSEIGVRES